MLCPTVYTCLQKKTLRYLKELNRLNEISVIGDYVKFGKYETFLLPYLENVHVFKNSIIICAKNSVME